MKKIEQFRLIEECLEWFEYEYPELIGCVVPVVFDVEKMDVAKNNYRRYKGFSVKGYQTRLMFLYDGRSYFFQFGNNFNNQQDRQKSYAAIMSQKIRVFTVNSVEDFLECVKKSISGGEYLK